MVAKQMDHHLSTGLKGHTMTPDQLRTIGEILYGPRFKHAMAAGLFVSYRHLDRWLAGSVPIPMTIEGELADICYKQIDGLDETIRRREQELVGLLGMLGS